MRRALSRTSGRMRDMPQDGEQPHQLAVPDLAGRWATV